ncbi:MAG: phosphoribosylformylglycinamidine cyclo-ligase [Oscillospiraceae bacterium]|jgi:phosphoribosylformylglycinamidine cyclo-ligase|nr:phosphoribosylformylglycinamidine cyclo-ligase [Oscillospiraceae bacterium]
MSDSGYARAGVDVNAGYEAVRLIGPHVKSTFRKGALGGIGGFGGLFEPDLRGMKRPVTVSGTDGVGTKQKIAFLMDKHDTVGIDCVAMCVNDIVCAGAQPLFFLDYIAVGRNVPSRVERIVAGVAAGCRQAGCALIGGETAEHPGLMPPDEYDLAGFSVGLVDYEDIIDGAAIVPGDVILGLGSDGLHSNGFSLVRKILGPDAESLGVHVNELGRTLGEELLHPTRIYVKTVLGLIARFGRAIKGVCHITGGGLYENVPRVLPVGVRAVLRAERFPKKPIFSMLARLGGLSARDMYGTFNMGVGMALVVPADAADAVAAAADSLGEAAVMLGECVSGEKGVDILW